MTAYLVALWVYEGLGGTLATEPTAGWWAQRWLWLLAPSAVLAVLVALFARFELAARRPRERQPAESSSLSHGRWTVQADVRTEAGHLMDCRPVGAIPPGIIPGCDAQTDPRKPVGPLVAAVVCGHRDVTV